MPKKQTALIEIVFLNLAHPFPQEIHQKQAIQAWEGMAKVEYWIYQIQ